MVEPTSAVDGDVVRKIALKFIGGFMNYLIKNIIITDIKAINKKVEL